MFEQLRFYISHSLNDLQVNKRLTFFALLSVAAGVAAIVSLQTLAVMISNTLEVNLQATNRGDFSISMDFGGDDGETDPVIAAAIEAGTVTENEVSFFGQSIADLTISQQGVGEMEAWIAENGYNANVTYRVAMANQIGIFTGTGAGVAITDVETGEQISQLSSIMVDTDVYPFYSDLITTDGQTLSAVMQAPTDIVLGDSVANNLGVEVGDIVQVSGASENFTVRGIVEAEQEIRNFSSDFFSGVFGFYYLDISAQTLFDDVGENASIDTIYIQLDDPSQAEAFGAEFLEAFSFVEATTIADLREQNEALTTQIDTFVAVMGLISLLLGSIGIINTMQVVVRRRMLEVAVLKTLGLQSNQITILFLTEALLVGVVGSLIGVVLGWGATFALQGVVSGIFGSDIMFMLAPLPAINGIVVGILVATVFGFLPTLTAGQVRPGIVLRPAAGVVPRAGILQSLLALSIIIVTVSVIVQGIIGGSFVTAFLYVAGAFLAAGVIYLLLVLLIWIIGRFFPAFGLVDLKISLRQMLASRNRGASTLLALVVGVFSLSTITLFAESITGILESALESTGGNVLVTVQNYNQLEEVEAALASVDGVNDSTVTLSYTGELVSFNDSETGESYSSEALLERAVEVGSEMFPFFPGNEEDLAEASQERVQASVLNAAIEARDTFAGDTAMISGRDITAADSELPVLVLPDDDVFAALGLTVGDTLTYTFTSAGGLFSRPVTEEVTFEIIGIQGVGGSAVNIGLGGSGTYAPAAAFPEAIDPNSVSVLVDVDDEQVPALRRALATVTGVFVLETAVLTQLISSLLGTFTAFPTIVALLGLVVGGVVIANSVALATMERRQQIAVMKSVGLQRERVLGMLLLENGILGFIGGLMGVGFGLLVIILFAVSTQSPLTTIPYALAFGLMMLCVGVALLAAITSAWDASGEKPLTVLRYE